MGRHGNKGVVGAIIPKEKMPRLPNVALIPKNSEDVQSTCFLNLHGVISRMNVGQLLETHIGWSLHSGVKADDLSVTSKIREEKTHWTRFFGESTTKRFKPYLNSTVWINMVGLNSGCRMEEKPNLR